MSGFSDLDVQRQEAARPSARNQADEHCRQCREAVVSHEHTDGTWRVTSTGRRAFFHKTWMTMDGDWHCTCEAGEMGRKCWHVSLAKGRSAVTVTVETAQAPKPRKTLEELFD